MERNSNPPIIAAFLAAAGLALLCLASLAAFWSLFCFMGGGEQAPFSREAVMWGGGFVAGAALLGVAGFLALRRSRRFFRRWREQA